MRIRSLVKRRESLIMAQSVRSPETRAIFAEMLFSTYDKGECPPELQRELDHIRDPENAQLGRDLRFVGDQVDREDGIRMDERVKNLSIDQLSSYGSFKDVRT